MASTADGFQLTRRVRCNAVSSLLGLMGAACEGSASRERLRRGPEPILAAALYNNCIRGGKNNVAIQLYYGIDGSEEGRFVQPQAETWARAKGSYCARRIKLLHYLSLSDAVALSTAVQNRAYLVVSPRAPELSDCISRVVPGREQRTALATGLTN